MNRFFTRRQLGIFTTVILSLFNNNVASKPQQQNAIEYDLILAGGGLTTCSSFSPKNCQKKYFSNDDLQQILYQFTDARLEIFNQSQFYRNLSAPEKLNINSLLSELHANTKQRPVNKNKLKKAIKDDQLYRLYQALPDSQFYALHDFFEVRQTSHKGERKREVAQLQNNKNPWSRAIFETFFEQAKIKANKKGKSRPRLIAITASARDPFESADFYQSVFNHFDADVHWLPIDKSLQAALDAKSHSPNACQQLEQHRQNNHLFDRARIYPNRTTEQFHLCQSPQLATQLLADADGIFFNGGDQSKTIAALTDFEGKPNQFLQIIKQAVDNKQVVVAGTSAGTAVQAGGYFNNVATVMLTNGAPEYALTYRASGEQAPSARCSESSTCQGANRPSNALSYRAGGGTGLFSLGLLDTHFSERDREVRLAAFAHQSQTRFAFGVDEATALLVANRSDKTVHMSVVGENGVFILDRIEAHANFTNTGKNYVTGISHFINAGDNASYDPKTQGLIVNKAEGVALLTQKQKAKFALQRDGLWRKMVAKQCGTDEIIAWSMFDYQYRLQRADDTEFWLTANKQCSYTNLPFVISQ